MDEKSYHPHILRVKRWKNNEQDLTYEEIKEYQMQKEIIEFSIPEDSVNEQQVENENLIKFEDEACGFTPELNEFCTTNDDYIINEDAEREEMIELNLGPNFVKSLESMFGYTDYEIPEGISPKIQIRKSMAQELHALWIESLQQQILIKQEQLEKMIQKGML